MTVGGMVLLEENYQNWIPRVFMKKTCTTFIEDTTVHGMEPQCQCGALRNQHVAEAMEDNFGAAIVTKWTSEAHTSEKPTDAFGDIEFGRGSKRVCKFVRLSNDTDMGLVYNLITYQWKIDPPNLVVSVVGGDGDFNIKSWLKDTLRKGLVKAAQRTGAWIMTGGMRTGIGKYVGEAVRDHTTASSNICKHDKVIAMGIAPWGLVSNRDSLINPKGLFPAKYYMEKTVGSTYPLDNNYSAMLLVDDGTQDKLGAETNFRAKLEEFISRQKIGIGGRGSIEIPVLCMVIAGEAKMLERVYNVVKSTIPCLLMAGSGGMTDCLSEILEESLSMESAQDLIQQKLLQHFPHENVPKMSELVKEIVLARDLVTVYQDQDGSEDEFENVILRALVKAGKRQSSDAMEYLDELKLAVAWNRVDIASTELFHGEIAWRPIDLMDTMTVALVNNKPSFVKLFLDNGMNIVDYLTYGRLEELYSSISRHTLLYSLMQMNQKESTAMVIPGKGHDFTLYEVSKVLRDLLRDICMPFYTVALEIHKPHNIHKKGSSSKALLDFKDYKHDKASTPWRDLFIWAILQHREEMAVFFWEMGSDSVNSALAATTILREMSRQEMDAEEVNAMRQLAGKFEHLAIGVFNACYCSNEAMALKLLVRCSKAWMGCTCLQLANAADSRNFFAQDGVQAMLTENWWGDMKPTTPAWKLILTFFFPPLIYCHLIHFKGEIMANMEDKEEAAELVFGGDSSITSPTEGQKKPQTYPSCMHRWKQFWGAPVTSFFGNVVMYLAFLALFAYVLLLDFAPALPVGPARSELVLYFWVMTMVLDEIHQSFFRGSDPVTQKLRQYLLSPWNYFDMIAIMLFIVGAVCRLFELSFEDGRTILCLDFMVFALRLIGIFTVSKHLGPKIIIVQKMMKDVFLFLFFLGLWLIAYGVATEGLLHPNDMRISWTFRRVFYRPFLQIFGLIAHGEIDAARMVNQNCTDNPIAIFLEEAEPCANTYANWLVLLLLVVFLLVANVLLLNLLIATFSYTFSKVQGNSDIYWKFQRYNLIEEYHNRPALAPPFIILSHLNIFIKRIIHREESKKNKHFRVVMTETGDSRIIIWEAVQKENYLLDVAKLERDSDSERLRRTSQKVDNSLTLLAEVKKQDRRVKNLEDEIENCSTALSWMVEMLSNSEMGKGWPMPPLKKVK